MKKLFHQLTRVEYIGALTIAMLSQASYAQTGATPGVPTRAPIGSCPGSCYPTDFNPCCKVNAATCTRTDFGPYITGAGTLTRIEEAYDCIFCLSCCPCCPVRLGGDTTGGGGSHGQGDGVPGEHDIDDPIGGGGDCCECWNIPAKNCMYSIGLTHTESANTSVSATVEAEVGAPGVAAIKSSLESTLGIVVTTTYSFESQCGWEPLPACADGLEDIAFIEFYTGKTVEMEHEWTLGGTWASCWWGTCGIAGNTVGAFCMSETSTSSGDPFARLSCGNTAELVPCGD